MRKLLLLPITFFFLFSFFSANAQANKETGDNPSARDRYASEMEKDPALGYVPYHRLLNAINHTTALKAANKNSNTGNLIAAPLNWIERGPIFDSVGPSNGNTRGGANTIGGHTSGRMRAFLLDTLNDPTGNTAFVGGVAGGLWKCTNFLSVENNWTPVNDRFDNLAVSSIAQDPTNPQIIYFSTGEPTDNADRVTGLGVWKSTNGGTSFTWLPSTANYMRCFKIGCDAAGNVYLACRITTVPVNQQGGLFRSTNGGTSWTDITPNNLDPNASNSCTDFEFTTSGNLNATFGYRAAGNVVNHRYTTSPLTVTPGTWLSGAGFRISNAAAIRTEIAVSGNVLYAVTINPAYNTDSCYKSIDGGANWTKQNTVVLPTGLGSGQGWYNISLAINPLNTSELISGGLDGYRSVNDGATWTRFTFWVTTSPYVHADHHYAQYWIAQGQTRIIMGTDGGVFYSNNNGTTFTSKNKNLGIKQFYSAAIHPTAGSPYLLAGAQDNGTHSLSNPGLSYSIEVTGGDGCIVHINQQNPLIQFGSYVFNQYRRSTNGGASWTSVNLSGAQGLFVNPFDYDDAQNIMYCSNGPLGQIRRWDNANTTNTSTVITLSNLGATTSLTSLKYSPYTANRVFFGTNAGTVYRLDNANTATSPTGAAVNISGGAFPAGTIICVNTGTDDNNLVATYSNYGVNNVWVSTNGGGAWTAVDGNLPDMPVRWAMFEPGTNTKLYLATEAGIYTTTNINGASTVWLPETTFPTVSTYMLKMRASDSTIVAGTHGRGLWTAKIPPGGNIAPTVTINQAAAQPDPTSVSPINFTVVFDQAVTGFATGDVTLTGTAGASTGIVTGSGTTYNVAVSGMTTSGTVIATIPAGVAINATNDPNTASTSTDNTVTFNLVAANPNVTINQAAAQPDPTSTSPINFTVVFSQAVTGFATGDVVLTGTAGATIGTVTGTGTTYNVAVSGMTASGTVIATVPAGVAINATNDPNNASTSTDNTVTYNAVTVCGNWVASTVYPIPVLDQAVASVGANLYSFAGVSNSAVVTNSYRFDGTTWTPILAYPVAVEYPASAGDGTNVFIMAGALTGTGVPQTTVYRYNVALNTYTLMAPCNVATWNPTAVYLNGKIYKFGGTTATATVSSSALEIYDIATNTWSAGANMPAPGSFIGGFTDGTFIYACGGLNATGTVPSLKTYRYTIATNTWDDASIADLPATRWGPAYGFINGKGILAGGYVGGALTANISNTAISWDPVSNTWTSLNNLVGERSRFNGGVIGSSYYAIGGRSQASAAFVGTNINQKLTCGAPANNPNVTINQAATQPDPTGVSPINFTVVFDQVVTGFATGDVVLTGTAGATTGIVSGSGTTYNVAVSGMTSSGTVIATIPAGVAVNATNDPNNPSTSTDNTVTYNVTCVPPTVNPVPNQTVCAGSPTAPVNFTSTPPGATFAWTNNTPSIGLAASGTGNIASFIAQNATAVPVTATITVTPTIGGTSTPVTIPLNNQTGTFGGTARGYWFTAPTAFTMTALRVPTDASAGNQNIAVVRFNPATPPPAFPGTTNAFTTLFLTQNNVTVGNIPVNIPIAAGDVIGILGTRGADINSYSATPNVTTIAGFSVPLTRMGMQFPLATTAPQQLWQEAAFQISRVFFDYTTGTAGGCTGTPSTFTITVNPNPGIVIVADPGTTICEGDPTLLTVRLGTSSPVGTLYTQGTTPVNGSPSQVFEPANAAFTSQSADDFTVPAGTTWTVTQVTANGIGAGVPTSVNVFFYNNSGSNLPGTAVASYNNVTTFTQAGGNYTVTLPSSLNLSSGTYWLSVQVNMSFATSGQWFWGNFGATNIGNEYAWQNPGGGFGTPCTNWGYGGTGCNVGGGPANRNNIFSIIGSSLADGGPLPPGYTFLWSPAAGLSSTTSNPVACAAMNTTLYTVVVTGPGPSFCSRTASILITVNKRPTVTTQPVSRTNCAGTTATFTVGGTGTGLAYQWQVSTNGCAGPWVNIPPGAPYLGVNTSTLTINPVSGLMNGYGYRVVLTGTCAPVNNANISNCALLTVNPLPNVAITPAGPVCGGVACSFGTQLSVASAPPPVPGSVSVSSGTINLPIPDNTANGVSNVLAVAGVPANATITNISVALNMPHTYPHDMVFNLRGPNGQILSLYKHHTNATVFPPASIPTAGWYNAVVNSTSTTAFGAVPDPFRYGQTAPAGPYRPDALNGVTSAGYTIMDPAGFVSNVTAFNNLYNPAIPTTANGSWTLAMADGGPADFGTLVSWSITIDYTTPGTGGGPVLSYVWSPLAGLYTDAAACIPYTGTNTPVVYAAPTVLTVYTVTATNVATACVSTSSVVVNYTPPAPTVTPNPVTMCLGDPAVKLKSSSSTSFSNTFNSGTVNIPIPDGPTIPPVPTTYPATVSNITVSGIPAGATITAVRARFNVTHAWVSDLVMALRAPNGSIVNLDALLNRTNQAGANFTNTVISSAATNPLGGAAPYTGTFADDAAGATFTALGFTWPGGPVGFVPTTTQYTDLFTTGAVNGVWSIGIYDAGAPDGGTLNNWSLDIDYTVGVLATAATWSPTAGLWNDAAATIPYAGTAVDSVWTRPTPAGVYNYQVTVQGLSVTGSTIPLPPQVSTFTGNVRGYWFVAPSSFTMTSVEVPTSASSGTQNIAVLRFNGAVPPPAFPGTTNAFTTLFLTQNNPSTGPITVNIPINAGDVIGMLGVRSNINSYSGNPPNTTIINGTTVNLTRMGMQFPLATTAPQQIWQEPAFQISRVFFTYGVPVAGCTSPARTVVVTVNQPTTLSSALPIDDTTCTNQVAAFTTAVATGTGPHSYAWEVSTDNGNNWTGPIANGGVYSGATTATLTITSPPFSMNGYMYRAIINGAAPCGAVRSRIAKLTVNPLPTVNIFANRTALFPGLTATITSTVSPFAAASYTWLRNGVVVPNQSASTLTVNVDQLGTYRLRVTDINGCTGESPAIGLTIRDSATAKCFIYPNPTSGTFQVRYYSSVNNVIPRTLTVLDAKGDRVFTQMYPINSPYTRMDVDMRAYGKGIYWVEIGDINSNRLSMCRVVIQ